MVFLKWCFDPAMTHHQGDGNSLRHLEKTMGRSSFWRLARMD
jgi:hypothetical protein